MLKTFKHRLGLVIEKLLVRLPTGALPSQLGQLSLPSLRGRWIEFVLLHGWG